MAGLFQHIWRKCMELENNQRVNGFNDNAFLWRTKAGNPSAWGYQWIWTNHWDIHTPARFMVNVWKGFFVTDLLKKDRSHSACILPSFSMPGGTLEIAPFSRSFDNSVIRAAISVWNDMTVSNTVRPCQFGGGFGLWTGERSPLVLIFPSIRSVSHWAVLGQWVWKHLWSLCGHFWQPMQCPHRRRCVTQVLAHHWPWEGRGERLWVWFMVWRKTSTNSHWLVGGGETAERRRVCMDSCAHFRQELILAHHNVSDRTASATSVCVCSRGNVCGGIVSQ